MEIFLIMRNKLPILNSFIIILLLQLFGISAYASKTYEGKVVTLVQNKLTSGTYFAYWGMLRNTARSGSIIKPQITNKNGDVIDKGTVIIQLETTYWKAMVDSSKAAVDGAKQDLLTAEDNYRRYQKLSPTGASSLKIYQDMRAAYYTALGNSQAAKANLIESERVLKACTHIAPFEGIVDKVLFGRGHVAGNPATVEVSQLNPIGIQLTLTRNEANKINSDTPISIFKSKKNNQPLGVYNGYSILNNEGIILLTKNYPVINGRVDSIKVRECHPVFNFYTNETSDHHLGVPVDTLIKDDTGYFVWRAKDRKMMQSGRGMDPTFQIEKVYVTPGNLKRLYSGFTFMRILKEPGKLESCDVLLSKPHKNLKTGDWVTLLPERYVLMPGDKVKVVIGD